MRQRGEAAAATAERPSPRGAPPGPHEAAAASTPYKTGAVAWLSDTTAAAEAAYAVPAAEQALLAAALAARARHKGHPHGVPGPACRIPESLFARYRACKRQRRTRSREPHWDEQADGRGKQGQPPVSVSGTTYTDPNASSCLPSKHRHEHALLSRLGETGPMGLIRLVLYYNTTYVALSLSVRNPQGGRQPN